MFHLLPALIVVTLGGSPNLLDNGSFELQGTAGWQLAIPPGGECVADTTAFHSGKASCRLSIPKDAPVSWYSANQRVSPSKEDATYTLRAYVKTSAIQDGAGAYISLAFFDRGGTRLAFSDSWEHLQGTNPWRPLTVTGHCPTGASEVRAALLIRGHGTAWFDDVQAEEGATATAFQPSLADTRQQARQEAAAAAAAEWRRSLSPRRSGQARIAILDEKFPPGDGHPSDPAVLERALAAAGYAMARVNARQLANSMILDPAEIHLLVIPTGDAFPAAAQQTLVAYLQRRGGLLTMGGFAFDRPLVQFQGAWSTVESLPLGKASMTAVFPRAITDWTTGTNRREQPQIRVVTGPDSSAGIELHTPALDLWDVAVLPIAAGKLPSDWTVTRFWAKADAHTTGMEFEWQEEDGSRWSTVIHLSAKWKQYTLFPSDLTYRLDNHIPGRGVKGDQFCPAKARRMQFGISAGIAAQGQSHTIWIADARVQADAAGALRNAPARINCRWAPIRDALWPEPDQIGVFDPSFPLRDVARTTAAAGQTIVTDYVLESPLSGYSAVGMLGINGHGFGPNRARWIPLLECSDRFGRPRGHAGAVLHHFTGTFAGSSWAIFGVNDRDFFSPQSPAIERVLLPTVKHLLRRIYLHETDTALACYRDGETVKFRTRASNFGRTPRSAEVRLVCASQQVLSRKIDLKPGETVDVQQAWKPERYSSDYYRFAAELWEDGRCVDREENAFVAWSPALLAKGSALRKDGTRFLLNNRPQFLMGCQTYWGQNSSVTARSPAAFDRDFRQMRDYGLRWTRCFLPFTTEEDKRTSDAIVQLAQKYGIVLYHTPNLYHTADPAELAKQQETSQEIARRYLGVPGMAVDICNEPSFSSADAALGKRFGRAGKTTGPWDDLDAAAFWRCMADAERAWAQANCSAIHAGDPARLASVGWSQGWGGGDVMKDPLLASLDLDFTDRHYYGPPAKLPPELKDVDLRGLGKPFILGECGAKDHPTFKAADPWGMGDDDDSYDARFLLLGHQALGLGAAAMSSWHWRDPMEGAFPCGIIHPTGVPRPTALLYRAMALAFGRLKPSSVTPKVYLVLPDEARMGGGRDAAVRAFHRAADLLVSCRVDFALTPDSLLDRLPKQANALVYPAPVNPSDAVLARLQTFVEAGGFLYLSGDIGYDARRRPTSDQQLHRLCGVERTSGGLSPPEPIQVKLAGATSVVTEKGHPLLTRYRQGKGEAWFAADLIELAGEMKSADRDRYRRFLEAAGEPGIQVLPDRAELHVFRVPGEDADALVLHNAGPAVKGTVGQFSVELAENGAGFLLVGHDGSLRAIESQGMVTRGGKPIAQIRGHAFVVAWDGVDLAKSQSLLLLPLAAGEVRLNGSLASAAEAGEMHDGKWQRLASLSVRTEDGQLIVSIPPAFRREMIRVTPARK